VGQKGGKRDTLSMVEREILGEIIWECDEDEARRIWTSRPDERWRLWTHDEVTAHLLDTPQELAACISQKKAKPGRLS